jgi:hypothetical protein
MIWLVDLVALAASLYYIIVGAVLLLASLLVLVIVAPVSLVGWFRPRKPVVELTEEDCDEWGIPYLD